MEAFSMTRLHDSDGYYYTATGEICPREQISQSLLDANSGEYFKAPPTSDPVWQRPMASSTRKRIKTGPAEEGHRFNPRIFMPQNRPVENQVMTGTVPPPTPINRDIQFAQALTEAMSKGLES